MLCILYRAMYIHTGGMIIFVHRRENTSQINEGYVGRQDRDDLGIRLYAYKRATVFFFGIQATNRPSSSTK